MKRLFTVEDLLAALWLAVLAPASDGLFLDGGAATVFLVGAGVLFWVPALTIDRGAPPRSGWSLFLALGTCMIIIDAGLRALDAPPVWAIVLALGTLGLGAFVLVQHLRTGGRAWLTAPRWVRRALAWPFVVAMTESFAMFARGFVDFRGDITLVRADDEPAFIVFMLLFIFAAVAPMIFAYFVVAPRHVAYPGEAADVGTWTLRYLWALAWAAIGLYVTTPALAGLGWS